MVYKYEKVKDMVTEVQYTNIRRVLDNLTDHPMLADLTLEQVVRHAIRFISLHGYSKFYKDAIIEVEIHEFRGLLPCDLISIVQVKDLKTGLCLRAMTDSFTPGMMPDPPQPKKMQNPKIGDICTGYIPPAPHNCGEGTFKTQGRIIYTSFPEGMVQISYKGIPVDEDGFPLLIDNETYLNALEAYIKKQVFTVKFDTGKIGANVLQNTLRDYAVASANLMTEMTTPSYSEAQAISNYMTSLLPRVSEFYYGFSKLGSRQILKRH